MASEPAKRGAARSRTDPRTPQRGRGVVRYEALLDATDELLQTQDTDDVGLYQIAERAGVPPASAYHFFPTKEAAFLGLAQRYLQGFSALTRRPVPAHALEGWQALFRWDLDESMGYYHAHPPALKILLGGYGGMATRQANNAYNRRIGHSTYHRLNAAFHMPALRDPETLFHVNIEIIDAIWTLSFLEHGRLTEAFTEEAHRASVAYCRLYLPDHVELREEHVAALAAGEPVTLRPIASGGPEAPAS
jgi:AcrR family transcriptional regulator